MRRVREILRLKHACGASDRAIARSFGVARSTVALTLDRLAAAGLAWPLPETLSERVLEAMLYAGTGSKPGFRRKTEPDGTHVHRELRRPGVTLMLLWEEYRAAEPDGYAYSRSCQLYRAWKGRPWRAPTSTAGSAAVPPASPPASAATPGARGITAYLKNGGLFERARKKQTD